MIDGRRVIAAVPARSGSKGVPGKNTRLLLGKPLLAWSVEAGLATPQVDRVLVSTDGREIASIAARLGAEIYMRPAELSSDSSLIVDTIRHLRRQLRAEGEKARYMVLLEPTSPLRAVEDISACIERVAGGYDSVATFVEALLNPHRAWRLDGDRPEPFVQGAIPWLSRQLQPEAWQLNGAVYAFDLDGLPDDGESLLFGRIGAVRMSKTRSLDIDEEIDFAIAERVMLADGKR